MIRLARYEVSDILPLIGGTKKSFTLSNGEIYWVNMNTPRLECIRRNQQCVWCGRTGNVFVLEKHVEPDNPHLNLYHYTDKGGYLLMTRDHLVPRCRGGKDTQDNLATFCAQCNQAKGTLTPLQFVCKMTDWPLAQQMRRLEKEWLGNRSRIYYGR